MASLYCVSAVRTAPLRRRASGVIQPPVAWPASVGCSNVRRAPPSAHSKCFTTVNQGLLSMPMTFHVSSLGCVFMAASHARHATFSALSRSAVGTVMVHMHQPQYLPAAVGVFGGCVTLPSSTRCHDWPPSSVTSTRMILRPPPL